MSNDRMPTRDEYLTALFGAGAVPSAYAEPYTPLSKRVEVAGNLPLNLSCAL
jgi:hypothetical protein